MSTRASTQLMVMVYDVSSDRRRTRLFNTLKQYGVPVQKSAFEARLDRGERKQLADQVACIIDVDKDRFVMYPISSNAEERVVSVGLERPEVKMQTFFII